MDRLVPCYIRPAMADAESNLVIGGVVVLAAAIPIGSA
jgi:hypothetical protein